MAIICTRCGGTNVSCEAVINPNTKEFEDFVDEAFTYGWCEKCSTDVILSDTEQIQKDIKDRYKKFVSKHHREPESATCDIARKDGDEYHWVKIQLSQKENQEEDDKIFFYCREGVEELKKLATFSGEDFIVTWCHMFE